MDCFAHQVVAGSEHTTLRSLKDGLEIRIGLPATNIAGRLRLRNEGLAFPGDRAIRRNRKADPMSSILRRSTFAALACCMLVQPLHAGDAAFGNLVVTQAWSRATPGGAKVAGGYLTIENRGAAPDRLLFGSTERAKKLELHEMAVSNGVMSMRPIAGGLTIEPGGSVKFAPGGNHLMLVDLDAPLRQGEQVPVTLTFERAGEIKALFDVQGMGAQAPAPAHDPEAVKTGAAPVIATDEKSFFTHLHAERAMANVTISPDRAGPVEIAIQLENADELPLTARAVTVTLGNSESGIAPVTVDAEQVSNDQWRVRMSAPVAGRRSLGLGITITASDIVNVVSPILIR
jgi:copper(I)-binding protein